MTKIEEILVTNFAERMATAEIGGVQALLVKKKHEQLKNMYTLFKRQDKNFKFMAG